MYESTMIATTSLTLGFSGVRFFSLNARSATAKGKIRTSTWGKFQLTVLSI